MASVVDPYTWADLTALPDLDNRVVRGPRVLLEALARRLITPRGGLWYDASYGFDLRTYLHSRDLPAVRYAIETGVEAQVLLDPRVLEANCTVVRLVRDTLECTLTLETTIGPWAGIVKVSDLTVEILDG